MQTVRTIWSGVGRNSVQAALTATMVTSFSLIFAVECAAAVLQRRERGNGRGAVVKAADGVQQLCAGAGVAHSRAAGALVDGGGLDARLIEQVGFEQVGLLERHAVLVHPDTQPAAALVLNECFHDELPPFN